MEKNKKRHHYVPRTYLRPFCDAGGKLHVYRKDSPGTPLHQSPDGTAFRNHYYSQPLPEGGTDSNTLENLFSQVESKWPEIVKRIAARSDVNGEIEHIYSFISLQRARVPAARDASEAMYAEAMKSTLRGLDASGKLPPKPIGHEDILDHVEMAIDPHQSIHTMVDTIQGTGKVLSKMGIGALYNGTNIPFITSDNPVVWFDPSIPDSDMQPYVLQLGGPAALLFPVTTNFLIYGHSSMLEQFASNGFGYGQLQSASEAEAINQQVCRFAYEAVFSQLPGHEALVREYASESPVLKTRIAPTPRGEILLYEMVFGARTKKPKWKSQ